MKIDRKLIAHLEDLARIELSPQEVEKLSGQLDRIVSYVEQLQKVDTKGVEPTRFVFAGGPKAMRKDEPRPGLPRELVLAEAPEEEKGFFRVPPIIGRGEE